MVDLGAGNCAKAAGLFAAFEPARYVAVDISADYLHGTLQRLQQLHPAIDMVGVGMDFSSRLALPADLAGGPALVFYPGSSIGNFAPDAALRLLREAHAAAAGGALLIGVDRVKPVGRAGGRLRRRPGRHRCLQPEPAAPPEPPDGQRFRRAAVAARGAVRPGGVTHRDAPARPGRP